jgi:integrase
MELLCLARAAGRQWKEIWPTTPKLEEASDVGRALSAEEEGRILGATLGNPSPYVGAAIRIALSTAMREGEIRNLQVQRLDIDRRELRVGKAKTPAGKGRGIPINNELYQTLDVHLAWLNKTFGSPRPEWYLFPFCDHGRPFDPTRPVTTLKSAWESVRAAARVDCRFHDLPHTALTKMAEEEVPEETMKAIAGHMSRRMLELYSHIRLAAKKKAVAGLTLATPIVEVPKVSRKVKAKRFIGLASK